MFIWHLSARLNVNPDIRKQLSDTLHDQKHKYYRLLLVRGGDNRKPVL